MSPIPDPQALAIDALSQNWIWRSMYMIPPFPLLNKVIQEQCATQDGKTILIAPVGHHNRGSHSYFDCAWTTLASFRTVEISCHSFISDGKSYHLHAWGFSCGTTKQQDFQSRSLGLLRHLGYPQQLMCTTIGGFASLTWPQDRKSIRMLPKLFLNSHFSVPLLDTHGLLP